MLYDKGLKRAMLDVLLERVSGIAGSINALVEEGYIPNKNKRTILDWGTILIHAYENIDVFTKEQQHNLDNIYNRVLKL
jgi:hypothetical protein